MESTVLCQTRWKPTRCQGSLSSQPTIHPPACVALGKRHHEDRRWHLYKKHHNRCNPSNGTGKTTCLWGHRQFNYQQWEGLDDRRLTHQKFYSKKSSRQSVSTREWCVWEDTGNGPLTAISCLRPDFFPVGVCRQMCPNSRPDTGVLKNTAIVPLMFCRYRWLFKSRCLFCCGNTDLGTLLEKKSSKKGNVPGTQKESLKHNRKGPCLIHSSPKCVDIIVLTVD